jgi:hypothetical protein
MQFSKVLIFPELLQGNFPFPYYKKLGMHKKSASIKRID